MNTPNKLTLFRIILVPFFIWFLYMGWNILSIITFAVASYTDYLDGHLARKRGIVTTFGKLMDPLADKILTISALVCFLELDVRFLGAWMVVLIIARELIVTGIRLIALSENKVIAASWWGKSKTVSQLVAIILMMVDRSLPLTFFGIEITMIAIWVMVVLTAYSGYDYVKKNFSLLQFK